MKQRQEARVRHFGAALLAGVAAGALLWSLTGCASSEKKSDADAAALPQDNSPPPDEETVRQIQRERAAQRPNVR